MQVIVEALRAQHRELDTALDGLDDAGWARPSRCPGWTVADVVLHLAQTDRLALDSARGTVPESWAGEDVDRAVDDAVARERGAPGPEVHRRWRETSSELAATLAGCDPKQPIPWAVGSLPARTLATTRLSECWVHTGDVLDGLGVEQRPSERLWHIARLAWRTFPYAFRRGGHASSGPVGVALRAPDGSAWEFGLDAAPPTVVRGDAMAFCLVATRRRDAADVGVTASGPDAAAALSLARTFA